MNNWKNYTVNIGYIKQNTSIDVKFESTRHLDIQHISPKCGSCTKFLDYKDNILTTVARIPSPIGDGMNCTFEHVCSNS